MDSASQSDRGLEEAQAKSKLVGFSPPHMYRQPIKFLCGSGVPCCSAAAVWKGLPAHDQTRVCDEAWKHLIMLILIIKMPDLTGCSSLVHCTSPKLSNQCLRTVNAV